MSNLALVAFNKRILYAVVGTPGTMLNLRMLENTPIYYQMLQVDFIPNCNVHINDADKVSLGNAKKDRVPNVYSQIHCNAKYHYTKNEVFF